MCPIYPKHAPLRLSIRFATQNTRDERWEEHAGLINVSCDP